MPQAHVVFCTENCSSRSLHCPRCRKRKVCTATSPGSSVLPAPETQRATPLMTLPCTTCLMADGCGCFDSIMGSPALGLQPLRLWLQSWNSAQENLHGGG